MLLHDVLTNSSRRFPDKVAIVHGKCRISYGVLAQRVDSAAAYLRAKGLNRGDRVILLIENSPEYIVSYFAVMKAGGIVVPLSHQIKERGLSKVLFDCTPSVVVSQTRLLSMVDRCLLSQSSVRLVIGAVLGSVENPAKGINPNISVKHEPRGDDLSVAMRWENGREDLSQLIDEQDVALILYTSGTTGKPKGVMLTHRNLSANAISIIQYLGLSNSDKVMVVLPFHYSYGNSLLTTHFMVGASLVLENSFVYPNRVLDRINEERVTGLAGVPSTFTILLNRSNLRTLVFASLRYVTQAGDAMSPKLARDLREAFPGTDVYIMYGQTEATARLTYLDPSELIRKAGSIGKAIPGVRITLRKEDGAFASPAEVGEIVAEGENVMAGYWNNPDDTKAVLKDGCLHTGDLARVDEEGFLYIVGRRSDMIKTGGHRVSPKEIEEVISGMPGVHEVAVVGVPDEMLGEAIRAFVVQEAGESVSMKDVLKHCSINLEPFLVPHDVVFPDELPKFPTGKVDRTSLKCWASQQRTSGAN